MISEKIKTLWKTVSGRRQPETHIRRFSGISDAQDDHYGVDTDFSLEVSRSSFRILENDKLDRIFKYCVVAALILHLSFIFAIPYLQQFIQPTPLLRPGEKVTQVRLVEPQEEEKKVEPPPKEAAAISDRDHTAVKERLPKIPPAPKSPLGHVDGRDQRMASLIPPAAPENPTKPEKESPEKDKIEEDLKKKSSIEKSFNSNKKPDKEPTSQQIKPESTRKKNIDLRPTPQEIAKGLSQVPGSTDFFPEGDVEEAVVDINTREDKFYSYMLHLKKKIEGVWVYPSSAAKSGLGGSLAVEFSIAKDGQLLYVNLLDSSGHTILDESALRAIKSAAPYFPFPPRLQAKRLKIRANFIYITSNYLRNIM